MYIASFCYTAVICQKTIATNLFLKHGACSTIEQHMSFGAKQPNLVTANIFSYVVFTAWNVNYIIARSHAYCVHIHV